MAPLVRQYRHELGLSDAEVAGMLGIDINEYLAKEIGKAYFEGDELAEIWDWFIPLAKTLPYGYTSLFEAY